VNFGAASDAEQNDPIAIDKQTAYLIILIIVFSAPSISPHPR
jgi:hypothetical protein